jgi:hypothetical protein
LTTRGRLDCACARCHCASVVWSDRAHPMRKTTPDTPRGSRSKRTTNNDLASIGNRSCPLTLRRIPWPPKPGNLPHLITCGWGPGHSFTSFFSRLLLCALIWRVVILHLTWLKRRVTALAIAAEPEPLRPKRHRSNAPKTCAGLPLKTPLCPL